MLVGANSDRPDRARRRAAGLIEARVRLGAWKDRLLRDPTLLVEAYIARTQAQDRWLRRVA